MAEPRDPTSPDEPAAGLKSDRLVESAGTEVKKVLVDETLYTSGACGWQGVCWSLGRRVTGPRVACGMGSLARQPSPAAPACLAAFSPPLRSPRLGPPCAHHRLLPAAKTFEELGLSPELLQGLYIEMKFERPSKIQAETLPLILAPPHRSMIAQAHNGSGKTTCFTLAMLSRVDTGLKAPQALCVCPTRELVVQNADVLERLGKFTGISITSTAAAEYATTRRARIDAQVVVGTHGKLRDWMSKRVLSPAAMKILVFDEADEMLAQDGFADDSVRMIRLLQGANPKLQILLFSATFNDRVKAFAQKVVPGANQVFVPKEDLSLDVIKQFRVVRAGAGGGVPCSRRGGRVGCICL